MITISEVAADKIKEILKAEGVPNHALRVTTAGGGCGCGPSYEIMIDDKTGDGDTVVEKNGARLFVDASTAKSLAGAELGFIRTNAAKVLPSVSRTAHRPAEAVAAAAKNQKRAEADAVPEAAGAVNGTRYFTEDVAGS